MEALVLKKDIESVLLYLANKGIAEPIEINFDSEEYSDILEQNNNSCEVENKLSDIRTKVNYLIEKLNLKREELIGQVNIPSQASLIQILADLEQKLAKIDNDSKKIVDSLNLSTTLSKRIDQKLLSLKVNTKKATQKETSVPKESSLETLLRSEQRFLEIEKLYENTLVTSERCASILRKIMRISRILNVKIPMTPNGTAPFPPDDKTLKLIDQVVTEKQNLIVENKDLTIKELTPIHSTIQSIMNQIPKIQNDLKNEMLGLKFVVNKTRQAIKTSDELKQIQLEISSINETLYKVEELVKTVTKVGILGTTAYFEAWVPESQAETVTKELKKLTSGKSVIKAEPPGLNESSPTVLKPVPRLFEAFEKLTFSLGYPRPDEFNPVFLMAVTFPFLFGIMFADVGQGAILLAAGLLLTFARRKVDMRKVGDISRYFLSASGLLILCGIAAMFFGFVFGEFFGPTGILSTVQLAKIGPFSIGGFDPMHEPLEMLRLAIFIGVILLGIGLGIRAINNIRRHRPRGTIISVFWLWFLLGGFIMWIYWGGISNFTKWFSEGLIMFIGLVILPIVFIGVVTSLGGGLMEGIDFSIEVFIETLDHTVSFGRLAALFLTHSALSQMFFILSGAQPGSIPLLSIPIIILGTIVALSLEGLVVFVHTLRLHWVEMLPEFYSGKGTPYKPLKLK